MSQDADFYRCLIDEMSDGVYLVDRQRVITYWSRGAERLTGYSAEEVMGRPCRDGLLCHVDDAGVQLCGSGCPLKATIHDGQFRDAHVFMHHADGHRQPVWIRAAPLLEDGRITGAIEIFSDDSAVRDLKSQMNALEQQSLTDTLTGLGNRRLLERRVEACLSEWQRYKTPFGVLMVDIDLFKDVNDRHGHSVGDEVLAMVARTLAFGSRGIDAAFRYGGEEFVVLVSHATPDGLMRAAERLRILVETSHLTVEGQSLAVTVSIGAALAAPSDSADTLLQRADSALYEAKNDGRNCVRMG
jgi:diguanylate cyclase (GGDEF)-like protein/PAS domain S-box-containing protein